MTKVQHPIVVIGIPVYNESKYIKETLDSVAQQTWTDFRVLISDNASTDDTGLICQQYCDQDSRFVYVCHDQNKGAIFNFQYLLDNTESPYFMWLGGHDLLHPDFLKIHMAIMESNKDITLSYSNTQFIDEDGNFQKVTNGGILADIRGIPYIRYIRSILNLGEYTPINQIIRRAALRDFRLSPLTYGPDNMPLSRLAYLGKVHRYSEPLYFARYWYHSQRETTEMERSTGCKNVGIDFKYFRLAYLEDFDKLFKGNILLRLFCKAGILVMIQIRVIWHYYHYNREIPILTIFVKIFKKVAKIIKTTYTKKHEK